MKLSRHTGLTLGEPGPSVTLNRRSHLTIRSLEKKKYVMLTFSQLRCVQVFFFFFSSLTDERFDCGIKKDATIFYGKRSGKSKC